MRFYTYTSTRYKTELKGFPEYFTILSLMNDLFERNEAVVEMLKELDIHLHDPAEILYKFVKTDDAKKILTDGTLMYQKPERFNDPLDPHPALLDVSNFVRNHNKMYSGMNNPDDALFERSMALVRTVKRNIINTTGILSLTTSNTNTLMWSHYADKHTGVCLGFRNLGFEDADGIRAVKIKYADNVIPQVFTEPFKSNSNTVATVNLFCTKAKVWEYEQEVRIMSHGRVGPYPINPGYLCEVYFGVNATDDTISEIMHLVKEKGYKLDIVGRMKTSDLKFELNIQPLYM